VSGAPAGRPSLGEEAAALAAAARRYVATAYPVVVEQVGDAVTAAVTAVRATLEAAAQPEPAADDTGRGGDTAPPARAASRVERIEVEE
jgi:hypothetical protein